MYHESMHVVYDLAQVGTYKVLTILIMLRHARIPLHKLFLMLIKDESDKCSLSHSIQECRAMRSLQEKQS